jgi:hypothetical protein
MGMRFVKFPTLRTAAAVYLAGVTKRWAESAVYDRMADTTAFARARSAPPALKYLVEAALNWLGAVLQESLPEGTPTQRYVRMVLEDAPSEVAKRLINGGRRETAAERPFDG